MEETKTPAPILFGTIIASALSNGKLAAEN
jgi:hypothetical protein